MVGVQREKIQNGWKGDKRFEGEGGMELAAIGCIGRRGRD